MTSRLGGAVVLAALALAACKPVALHADAAKRGEIRVVATPLPLNPQNPKQDRVGDFVFAGAVRLTSPDTSLFGGLSDLKVADDGTFLAVSDEGALLRGRIVLDKAGRVVGVDQARMAPLTGPNGKPLPNKTEADSEGLAVWPNGDVMVSFERHHRIWVYPAAGGPPHAVPMPTAPMPDNDGMEGLALAPREGPDAYWVAVEGGRISLCHLATACVPAAGQFPPPATWRIPSLFEMADGSLVVEHHHWDPVTGTRLTISVIENPAANPKPAVRAQLALEPPLTVDNVEGVSVVERAGGVKRFYLITDDNFSKKSQKTLLMAFDWTPPPAPATPKAPAK